MVPWWFGREVVTCSSFPGFLRAGPGNFTAPHLTSTSNLSRSPRNDANRQCMHRLRCQMLVGIACGWYSIYWIHNAARVLLTIPPARAPREDIWASRRAQIHLLRVWGN
ncbi:uncharacterized protein K452DRAFT_145323 [Aplosporella prunicola CBS 121167]|uniref:Uncharacterized protein n=1 Tax=Aplosporella prunicola CBS 121167 TaxID=1176127 RepID=A0A6A6BKN7_9PEZI|nr:uncharacterized protein K452DRAFT_145323 [Aplosporella prunicola CBS 121167]KAF2144669.1 hypothetical protein K452DRAFT_145323 [Aplosporella prunicola CBS 121167]